MTADALDTASSLAAQLARAIDEHPGVGEHSDELWQRVEVGDAAQTVAGEYVGELQQLGYRDISIRCDAPDYVTQWQWWPSRQRCAELARTATGARFERLMLGALLDTAALREAMLNGMLP